ncbi:molybdopterin-synthase adenylyltransferase MoeB [Rhodococcus cerastii]|nr:molybdopterin-synthase adenylyltransferase MoeB [Rhodococcus cerastii]
MSAPLVELGPALTPPEIRRYSRHLTIPHIGIDGQRRLKNARVLCVGAGGLGSPALMYLAAAGIGTLGIVDFDTVDESNLHRQIIHGHSDIGRRKVDSAAATIAEINPFVDVVIHHTALDSTNAHTIIADYDLIVDGTDNFATRYLVNDAAVLAGKPYVWGSIYRFDGQASVFWAEHGPCYRCLHPRPPEPGTVPSCAEGGVLGVLCASIAAIQVTEALKLLTGIGTPLIGSLMLYDALDMTYHKMRLTKNPDCALCGPHPTITDLIDYDTFCGTTPTLPPPGITAEQLHHWRTTGEDHLLVDVREPTEHAITHIEGSILIPHGQLTSGTALPDLPHDRTIVLYCKSGARSARALTALHTAGLTNAVHLDGGILSWITTIDPTLPTY